MGRQSLLIFTSFFLAIFFISAYSFATPEFSAKTGQNCKTCHSNPETGVLHDKGIAFATSGYTWPPEGGHRALGPIRKSVRLVLGFIHIVAAFFWFGTILYVHILLRPAYAAKGLPKGEVFLGLVSMAAVGITGLLLTISKINSLDVLYESSWGIFLSAKIILYLIMILSALFVVIFIGPRLKKGAKEAVHPKGGVFDPLTLSAFDGKDGRPAYIAYKGKVLDVTELNLWKNGAHMKHLAGSNLTNAIAKAPHGEEKLESLKVVGTYDATHKPKKTTAQKAFFIVAYMNLGIVFLVLGIIAFWRWGLWIFNQK